MIQLKLFESEPVDPKPAMDLLSTRDGEDFYKKYLASAHWKKKRLQVLERAVHKCERCGTKGHLEVHHLNYDHLGEEYLSDLLVVCKSCHVKEDELRVEQTEWDRYRKSVYSFGTKKYGEDWDSWNDPELVSEEYHEWLERRG